MSTERLRGVIAAIPTPVDESGVPDTERLRNHGRWALDNGCDALNVLGTTGEANSLPVAHRKRVMATASVGLDGKRLMAGTGTCDLPTTIDLTRFAAQMRFAAALVLPPFYYKNVTQEAVMAWFAAIVEATADTPIPVYIYNFPQLTGLRVTIDTLSELNDRFPDRIVGMKDSSGDFGFAAEAARIDDFDVFPGNENGLTRPEAGSFAGCISATANVTAPAIAAMLSQPDQDEMREIVIRLREGIAAKPLVPAVKYLVARQHSDPEFERVLPPHLGLGREQKAELDELMAA